MVGTRTVEGDGARLAVRDWGGDGRPLVLLHGLASSSRIFDLVAPRLSRSSRVVAYDQRGHGRSGKPHNGYRFHRLVADALAVVRALRLRRPVLLGHSWGGNVVLEVAVRHPRALAGALLLDGGFLALRDDMDWPTTRERLSPPPLSGMHVDEFRSMLPGFFRGAIEFTPKVEEIFLSYMRVDSRGRIRARLTRSDHLRILHAMWQQDTVGLLRAVRVPTLVLAARTRNPSAEDAGFMAAKRAAAATVGEIGEPVRFEWIDGIHDVPLQRPTALARRIEAFVRGLPS